TLNVHVFYFFFQAEDGIRDFHVTGVQTCALPISLITRVAGRPPTVPASAAHSQPGSPRRAATRLAPTASAGRPHPPKWPGIRAQIGRASCRERVEISMGGVVARLKTSAESRATHE